jgi:hypothetical protein
MFGYLKNWGHSLRPSRLQLTVRWTILLAWVVGLDAAATNWTLAVTKRVVLQGLSNGDVSRRNHFGYDGSVVAVGTENLTGRVFIVSKRPPTAKGLCYVWWPSVAGGTITLVVLALAATRNGRRLIAKFPLPRMTTRRLMIAVAVIGIEAALIINIAKSLNDPHSFLGIRGKSQWPPIIICLAAPPTLVFISTFGRKRSAGADENTSEHNQ